MAAEGEMGGWILSSLALRSIRPGSWIGFGAVIWMCPSWSPVYSILLSGRMSRGPADAASTCTLMLLASVSTDSRMTGLQAAAVDVHTGCNGRDDGVVGDRMGWSGRPRGRCAERWHHHACQGPLWQQLLLSTCLHVCITASQQNHPTMVTIILFSSTSLQPANQTGLSSSVRRMARDQWTSDGTPLQRLLCREHAAQEYDAPEPGASALSLGDCVTASAGTTTTGLVCRWRCRVGRPSSLMLEPANHHHDHTQGPGSSIQHL